MGKSKSSPIARFWAYVQETDTCWWWTGGKYKDGYGMFYSYVNGKKVFIAAHRYSYLLHNGHIPEGLWILHKCDNPSCVNPDHLFEGTCSDNVRDMHSKGRWHAGSRQKLNEESRLALRADHAAGMTWKQLSEKYNTCKSNVGNVLSDKPRPIINRRE